ncbi:BadF/BadG/BcrA/BcrD ATPase family protein [Kitasatospora paranensis]|uniref:BadF/BadG/BcrA/BcrD ATPase family protein n=1 Tax=Kitasatospora paranensis TaxID=258053 RepID=A0ABW2G7A0_9ACTN
MDRPTDPQAHPRRDAPAPRTPAALVAGVDVGGTGVRVALARPDGTGGLTPAARTEITAPTRTGARGIDAGALLAVLLPALEGLLAETGAGTVDTLAVGATGMATLGADLAARLPEPLARRSGAHRLVLAADAVAAYAGALGERAGVVVAAGTGMIALGTDLATGWHRSDGWGHLLGDCGGGAWLGRAALDAALRAHDGRPGGSTALLARAVERFGPPEGFPAAVQLRPDRAALLASLAPAVADCAVAGDPVAVGILDRAAEEIAGTAVAAAAGLDAPSIALTGRLFELPGLRAAVAGRLAALLPEGRLHPSEGDPLMGALRLAAAVDRGASPWPEVPPLLRLISCG